MLKVKDEGIILERTNLEFENQAVLNPGCIEKDGRIHIFYRAVRAGNFSTIGHAELEGRKIVKRLDHPLLVMEHDWELHGLEDPRIVFLDGVYYLFYTAYDGKNALIAYATSADLINFEKKGLVSAQITYDEAEDLFRQSNIMERYLIFESYYKDRVGKDVLLWEKDAFLFPKKIGGRFALIHRILPGIQVIYFDDFKDLTIEYWRAYLRNLGNYIVLDPKYEFENRNIGGGCPPIETPDGWVLVYHAVQDTEAGRIYHAAAALLDLEDPTREIARLPYPLFSPRESWEHMGDVKSVVFPTGAILKNNRLYIYYGAADRLIATKSVDLRELLAEFKKISNK